MALCLKGENDYIEIESKGITADMFQIPANRLLFQSIAYLYSKNTKPSPLTIMEILKTSHAKETIEEFGGIDYISAIEDIDVSVSEIDIIIEKFRQTYAKVKMENICRETEEWLYKDEVNVLNPLEICNKIDGKIMDLTSKLNSCEEVYKIGSDYESILHERLLNKDTVIGLETGFKQFDNFTGGLQPGELLVVEARSKVGKSVLLTNWAVKQAIEDDIPILYIDTELTTAEFQDRVVSMLSRVPIRELQSGAFGKDKDKVARIKDALSKLRNANLYHIAMPDFSIEKIKALAKKYYNRHNLGALYFDYIKIPSTGLGSLKVAQEFQLLGFTTSGLKDLAVELNIPIYTAAQENRSEGSSKTKDESNIGGSYRILQLASKLIFLVKKNEEEALLTGATREIQISFQRNGQSDCPPIDVYFDGECTYMEEV